jgi:anti-anti-sigma factor
MQIDEQRQGAVTVLRPKGPLIEADAGVLAQAGSTALAKSLGRVVLDAADVPYADSKGLEALLDLSEKSQAGGQCLRLAAAGETLREVLQLTGLDAEFEFYADVQTAVRSFL